MSVINLSEFQNNAPQGAPIPEQPQGGQEPPEQEQHYDIDFENNVTFYEIEVADKGTENYTAEQLREIQLHNAKYVKAGLTAAIFNTIDVCPCRNDEFMRRHLTRAEILGVPPHQLEPKLEQVDIDAFTFAVIVIAEHGMYKGISGVVRQCKHCKKIEIWGDAMIIGDMLAASTDRFLSHRVPGNTTASDGSSNNQPVTNGEVVSAEVIPGVLSDRLLPRQNEAPQSAPPETMEMGTADMEAINNALAGQQSDLKFESIPLPPEE